MTPIARSLSRTLSRRRTHRIIVGRVLGSITAHAQVLDTFARKKKQEASSDGSYSVSAAWVSKVRHRQLHRRHRPVAGPTAAARRAARTAMVGAAAPVVAVWHVKAGRVPLIRLCHHMGSSGSGNGEFFKPESVTAEQRQPGLCCGELQRP